MLPATIPIFPLPNAVLFPNVFMPLHIFEPRYRAMVSDALAGDRIIGMVLLKPGFEADYEGRPPVYPIGCAGVIIGSYAFTIVAIGGYVAWMLRRARQLSVLVRDEDRPWT